LTPDTFNVGSLMFKCSCGCCQKHASEKSPGGVTVAVAKRLGWHFAGGEWYCPLCSGNERMLNQIFYREFEPTDEDYGDYGD